MLLQSMRCLSVETATFFFPRIFCPTIIRFPSLLRNVPPPPAFVPSLPSHCLISLSLAVFGWLPAHPHFSTFSFGDCFAFAWLSTQCLLALCQAHYLRTVQSLAESESVSDSDHLRIPSQCIWKAQKHVQRSNRSAVGRHTDRVGCTCSRKQFEARSTCERTKLSRVHRWLPGFTWVELWDKTCKEALPHEARTRTTL